MPYPIRRSKTFKSRTRIRTRRFKTTKSRTVRRPTKRNMLVSRNKTLFPPRFKMKMRYTDTFVSQTNGVSANWQQYMLNGLYDPLITGTGHQPRGFDQICPVLYASYNVTGCKVLIEGRFESANLDTAPVTGQLYVGAQPSGTVVLPGSWSEALETKEFDVITRTDQQYVRFSKYYDIAKVVGVPRFKVVNEANYTGTSAANPTAGAVLSVGFIEAHPNQVVNFNYSITLVFYVEFFGPTLLPQS